MTFPKLTSALFTILAFGYLCYGGCLIFGCHSDLNSSVQTTNKTHLKWTPKKLKVCTSEFGSPNQTTAQCSTWVHERTSTIRALFKDSSIENYTTEYLALQVEELYICEDSLQKHCAESFDDHLNHWLTELSTALLFDYTPYCTKELVAIDVGHSPKRYGATSSQGKKEYDYNINLARQLEKELRRRQIASVVLHYDANTGSFGHRRHALNNSGATLFISIHHDSVQSHYLSEWYFQGAKQHYSDKFSGFSLFVSAKSPTFDQNKRFANSIGNQLIKVSQPTHHHAEAIKGEHRTLLYPQTGVYQFDNLGILRGNTIPSVLIEAGVLVNRNEERQLADPLYQLFLASNIASGINQYCLNSSTESF